VGQEGQVGQFFYNTNYSLFSIHYSLFSKICRLNFCERLRFFYDYIIVLVVLFFYYDGIWELN
jgi:hypothetical protein